jgi:hypothetical protein
MAAVGIHAMSFPSVLTGEGNLPTRSFHADRPVERVPSGKHYLVGVSGAGRVARQAIAERPHGVKRDAIRRPTTEQAEQALEAVDFSARG